MFVAECVRPLWVRPVDVITEHSGASIELNNYIECLFSSHHQCSILFDAMWSFLSTFAVPGMSEQDVNASRHTERAADACPLATCTIRLPMRHDLRDFVANFSHRFQKPGVSFNSEYEAFLSTANNKELAPPVQEESPGEKSIVERCWSFNSRRRAEAYQTTLR